MKAERRKSWGYSAGPPWIFSGRAFYQLHLVKADVAKRFIPSGLKIVQAFGYTLGGVYLAQYDDSPAGAFDELVIVAGTVWNPPTSCAWAARVLVNNAEARDHGRQEIGLPSKLASFSKVKMPARNLEGWWQWNPLSKLSPRQSATSSIDISEIDGNFERPLCKLTSPFEEKSTVEKRSWHGPTISMSLPSFSGRTHDQPNLLKYSCQLKCSVRAVKPACITTPTGEGAEAQGIESTYHAILGILGGKAVVALSFEDMEMRVEAPKMVGNIDGVLSTVTPTVSAPLPASSSKTV